MMFKKSNKKKPNPNKKVRMKQCEIDIMKRDSFLLGAIGGMGIAGVINVTSDFMKKRRERIEHKNAGSIDSLIGKNICK